MRKTMMLVPVLLLGACNMAVGAEGKHEQASRAFQIGTFDKIALAGSPDVTVTVGGAPSVRAEGDREALDGLDVRVENGELRIGSKANSWSFGGGHHHRLRVFVTVPSLAAASVAGSGDIRVDKISGASFAGSVAGSGDLALDHMEVGELTFSIAGSGDINAAGKTGKATLSTAGSGDVRAGGLEAGAATVSVMGSGDVQLHATQTAEINIMGSGDVHVGGPARCAIHKAGSGDAHCG